MFALNAQQLCGAAGNAKAAAPCGSHGPGRAARLAAPMRAFSAGSAGPRPARQALTVRAVAAPEAPPANKPTPSYLSTSDKYAVIDVGGTQHLVEEGRWYTCNRLQAEPGSKIQFGRVLAMKNEGKFTVGRPYLEGVVVEAEVLEELKGPKITVYKMKPKKHYQRKTGHRQPLTKFMVTKITT